MLLDNQPEAVAGIGAVVGGVVVKLAGMLIRKNGSDASQIRKELRTEVHLMTERVDRLSRDVDTWRERFYKMHEENLLLKNEVRVLRAEVEVLRSRSDVAPGHA